MQTTAALRPPPPPAPARRGTSLLLLTVSACGAAALFGPTLRAQTTPAPADVFAVRQAGEIILEDAVMYKSQKKLDRLKFQYNSVTVQPRLIAPGRISLTVPESAPRGPGKVKIRNAFDNSIMSKLRYRTVERSAPLLYPSNAGDGSNVARVDLVNGKQVRYQGSKDRTNRSPAKVGSVIIEPAAAGAGSTVIGLDDQQRVNRVNLPSGTAVTYTYTSANRALVSFSFPGGGQFNAPVDLRNRRTAGAVPPATLAAALAKPAADVPEAILHSRPREIVRLATGAELLAASPPGADTAVVNVTRNNGARPVAGATVTLTVSPAGGAAGKTTVYRGLTDDAGRFAVVTPFDPAPALRPSDVVNFLATSFGDVCTGVELLTDPAVQPAIIAATVGAAAIPGVGPAAAAVTAALDSIALALAETCAIVNASPAPGAPSVLDTISEKLAGVLDDLLPANVPLQASAVVDHVPGLAAGRQFSPAAVTFGNPRPTFNVDVGALSARLRAVLSWNTATDVDLHLVDAAGRHTYFASRNAVPNSQLDVDNTSGYGPENIVVSPTNPGDSYRVYVVYYSGGPPTVAAVQVFLDDIQVTSVQLPLSSRGQQADVGSYRP